MNLSTPLVIVLRFLQNFVFRPILCVGPSYESSLKNGPTLAIAHSLGNIWFFTVLLLNPAIFGMFEGVQ